MERMENFFYGVGSLMVAVVIASILTYPIVYSLIKWPRLLAQRVSLKLNKPKDYSRYRWKYLIGQFAIFILSYILSYLIIPKEGFKDITAIAFCAGITPLGLSLINDWFFGQFFGIRIMTLPPEGGYFRVKP